MLFYYQDYKFTLPPRAFVLQELENVLFQYAAIFACPRDLVQIDLLGQTWNTHKHVLQTGLTQWVGVDYCKIGNKLCQLCRTWRVLTCCLQQNLCNKYFLFYGNPSKPYSWFRAVSHPRSS